MDEDFEQLWSAYPRKKARADARKAWIQTSSIRPPVEDLIAAVQLQKKEWREPRFTPYLATWLRGERWADVPDAKPIADDIWGAVCAARAH